MSRLPTNRLHKTPDEYFDKDPLNQFHGKISLKDKCINIMKNLPAGIIVSFSSHEIAFVQSKLQYMPVSFLEARLPALFQMQVSKYV